MEVGVPQPVGGQPVDVRSGEVGPVTAEVGEAGVIEEHDDHVGSVLARVLRGGPPWRGFRLSAPDDPVEAGVPLHSGPLLGWRGAVGSATRAPWKSCVTAYDATGGPAPVSMAGA